MTQFIYDHWLGISIWGISTLIVIVEIATAQIIDNDDENF